MKILFLGLGGVGQRHLRNFHSLTKGQHEYFTVSNKSQKPEISNSLEIDKEVNFYRKYSIKVFNNLDEALSISPYITFISTPSALHFEHAKKALLNKSHVYLEKPATLSSKECNYLQKLSKELDLRVSVSFQLRFTPWVKKVKKIIESKNYGRPLIISSKVSEFMPDWHKYEDYSKSYASRKELGGGVVFTQIHEIDYLLHLFKDISFHSSLVGKFSDLNIDVEDTSLTLLKTYSENFEIPIILRQDYLGQPKSRNLEIQFPEVTLNCDFIKGQVEIKNSNSIIEIHKYSSFERNQAFLIQLESFLETLNHNSLPNSPVSLEEASIGISIAEKIKNY